MELRVLGPVEARDDGQPLPLGGVRPRTVVAALALGGEVISSSRLVEEVWRAHPPRSAIATLQSYLSRLRRILTEQRLVRHVGGYALELGEELDANRFERALRSARAARDSGRLAAATDLYTAALDRWRGEVAEGIDAGPIIREAAARLTEHRLLALEERIEVEMTAGHHHEVVGELEALTTAHPHRERLHAQRLVALYRAGRQVEALEAYRQARSALVDGLGIEPGPQLRELQQRVLDQDPTLGIHAAAVPPAAVVTDVGSSGSTHEGSHEAGSLAGPMRRAGRPSPGNVPAPLGSFVGRVGTRRDIAARLAGDARLITLVGAGGCGKTRLAQRAAFDVADGYPQGTWWVELAGHRDPELVERAVADALGLPASLGSARYEPIARRLAEGRQLLVLDNCEHLVDACAELVTELLRRCPVLRIVATSREPLDVDGEATLRVPSLQLAPPGAGAEQVLTCEAAQLLQLRANEAGADLEFTPSDAPTVARICRELDGIPLALELAGSRLNVLTLDELAERLRDRFSVLARGRRSAPARHRTLEAAIAWSYDLLDDEERRLLTRLSVFAGGFTVEDAEVVCAGDGVADGAVVGVLAALHDKSLVQRQPGAAGRARHDLPETVRSFAADRLDRGEVDRLEQAHADRYAGLAQRAAPELTGPDQVRWLNRLHADQDNLRMVLRRGGRDAARVAASAWWFWLQFGHAAEGDRWLRDLLVQRRAERGDDGSDDEDGDELELHRGAARLAAAVEDRDRAREHLTTAIRLADLAGRSSLLAQDHGLLARLAASAGEHDLAMSELTTARRHAELAGDGWVSASVEHHAADVGWYAGNLEEAAMAAASAEDGYQRHGDEWSACLARLGAARVARQLGRIAEAVELHRTNLARGLDLTVSSLDFVGLPQDLHDLATLAGGQGDHDLAVTLIGAAAALRTAMELPGSSTDRHERYLEVARDAMGEQQLAEAYMRARNHSAQDAVRMALRRTSELSPEEGPG